VYYQKGDDYKIQVKLLYVKCI